MERLSRVCRRLGSCAQDYMLQIIMSKNKIAPTNVQINLRNASQFDFTRTTKVKVTLNGLILFIDEHIKIEEKC